MSQGNTDILLSLMNALLASHGDTVPFHNHSDMHEKIDVTTVGEAPWEHFIPKYSGPLPKGVSEANIPTWMTNENDVWFCNPVTPLENLLANPDFKDKFDYMPYQECTEDGLHCFHDFMSGNWSWQQVVCLFI